MCRPMIVCGYLVSVKDEKWEKWEKRKNVGIFGFRLRARNLQRDVFWSNYLWLQLWQLANPRTLNLRLTVNPQINNSNNHPLHEL